MKTLKFLFQLAFLLSFSALSTVAGSANDNGTTAASFLKLGVGARGLAMGEAYTALSEGADSLFWNPAGLGRNRSVEVMLNHQPFLDSLTYNVGAFAIPMKSGSWALGYAGLKYDSIDSLDISGNKTGSFNADDQQFILGYGHRIGAWQAGAAVKYVHSSIADFSANAYAVDLGLGIPNPWSKTLSHAVTLQNLGSKMKFEQESDPLPVVAKFGNKISFSESFAMDLDFHFPQNSQIAAAIGAEYQKPINSSSRLIGRVGYGTMRKDLGNLSGLGVGGGLVLSALSLDYAWVPNGDLGNNQIFTVNYRFARMK